MSPTPRFPAVTETHAPSETFARKAFAQAACRNSVTMEIRVPPTPVFSTPENAPSLPMKTPVTTKTSAPQSIPAVTESVLEEPL